ncbi:MAG: hypothetical protein RIS94_3565, partial [Pseudomonadota bacterium]|jgi:lycopene beta-cyclase
MTSARLATALAKALPPEAMLMGVRVLACSARNATLADGTRIEARAVIDARGIRNVGHLTGGWQKFLGQRLKLTAPHGLDRPIVMDATVEQIDGYRFVYALPFSADEIFVEDTYYADGPALDRDVLTARIADWVKAQGWQVAGVLGTEQGVLPVVSGGDFRAFLRATGKDIARAGTRAGLFHPLTSYSVPDAVRLALAIAQRADLPGEELAAFCDEWSAKHWKRSSFYRALSAMLFGAAAPEERYRVLERFYRLDRRLIERFYAGRSTALDKARVLAGRPPVPVGKAIAVLAGVAPAPNPLTLAGMRK